MKYIKVVEIEAGMILAESIFNIKGQVLLKDGISLTEEHRRNLSETYKIKRIAIKTQQELNASELSEETKEQIKAEIKSDLMLMFKPCQHDEMMMRLCRAIIDYRIKGALNEG